MAHRIFSGAGFGRAGMRTHASNLVRTLPAIAVDVMAPDLDTSAHEVAGLIAVYHFAFAICQLPIGAALDRLSIRTASLALFGGTVAGSMLAALSSGPLSFLIAQRYRTLLHRANAGLLRRHLPDRARCVDVCTSADLRDDPSNGRGRGYGKAVSAINLAFFVGTAMMQSLTDPIAGRRGLMAMLLFMGGAVPVNTLAFLLLTSAKR